MSKPQRTLTVAEKLFNQRFLVHVQNKAFYTPFELEEIGFTSCGSVKNNETYLNEYRLINTTLDNIVEWNDRGDSIKLIDLNTATEMYRILDEHMNNWLTVTKEHPTAKLPPIGDFEAMDKLCEMLHPLVDVKVDNIADPHLLMLFGNAMNFSYLLPNQTEDGNMKEPYHPYSPKLYTYTRMRWER